MLPDFSGEFGFKKNNFGGWITGMLHQLEGKVDIALCFPIYNMQRAKDGCHNGHKYYSFPFSQLEYDQGVKERFKEVIRDSGADIIHIWGSEYPHALEMMDACGELGMLDRAVVSIQGLVSVCSRHFLNGIPAWLVDKKNGAYASLRREYEDLVARGRYEEELLRKARHVSGRTEWDRACVMRVNKGIKYYFCGEILRNGFYQHMDEWEAGKCEKHSIFASQSSYPVKGFHYLVKAMPDIMEDYPSAHIYVAGTDITKPGQDGAVGSYGGYIRQLIAEYGLKDAITFTGILDEREMVGRYLKANVFVSASSIENSPNSVCEAALIGCPVVASYVGGLPSLSAYSSRIVLYQQDAEYMLAHKVKEVFAGEIADREEEGILGLVDRGRNSEAMLGIYRQIAGGR